MYDAAQATVTGASAPVSTTAWWAVAHVDELAEVGSFIAREVGDSWLIAVRDKPDSVRVFENSCPHQGLPICVSPGRGKARSFQCPFHGWAFAIDGRYLPPMLPRRAEDRLRRNSTITQSRGLPEFEARTVGGIVFATLPERGARAHLQSQVEDVSLRYVSDSLGRHYLDSMDLSQVRTPRHWRSVYDNLLAAFGTEGLQCVAVNAFALVRGSGVHTVCAVIPRGSQGCTVTLVREYDDGDLRPEGLFDTTSQYPDSMNEPRLERLR